MSDNVLASFTPARREERAYDRTFRVGIIGTGWIAEAHAESYLNQPDVKIVALADLIPGKAEAFAKRYGLADARCYPDHKSLLAGEQLDAVSVCTYNTAHAQCAIDALAAGVNVLLEKPMSVTVQEAADIIRAEKQSGKLLSIGFQPRMDFNMQKIREIVQSGVLGKVYYIQTGGGRRRGIPNSTFIEKKTAEGFSLLPKRQGKNFYVRSVPGQHVEHYEVRPIADKRALESSVRGSEIKCY